VVSAGNKSGMNLTDQIVSLAGTDWDEELLKNNQTNAFLFDNIVAVYEKNVTLKVE
jgi:hypothetical protein